MWHTQFVLLTSCSCSLWRCCPCLFLVAALLCWCPHSNAANTKLYAGTALGAAFRWALWGGFPVNLLFPFAFFHHAMGAFSVMGESVHAMTLTWDCWSQLANQCSAAPVFPWHISENSLAVCSFSSLNVPTVRGIFLSSFRMSRKNAAQSSFCAWYECELLVWVLSGFSRLLCGVAHHVTGALCKYKDQTQIFFHLARILKGGQDGSNIPLISAGAALSFACWHCPLPENLWWHLEFDADTDVNAAASKA